MRALCTHCNNVWEPVKPTSSDGLRNWPKAAVCPRCGYWGTVEEKLCVLCGYESQFFIEHEVPLSSPKQWNVICSDCGWEVKDLYTRWSDKRLNG